MRVILQLVLFLVLSTTIQAFSTTNIQYLYGDFSGNSGFDTIKGGKHTVTLENFSTNRYGDFFGFADFTFADERFATSDKSSDVYIELSPRISLSKTSERDLSFWFVKDLYLAAQYNRQLHKFKDFEAWLYGIGSDLNIKGLDVLGLDFYKKEKNFGSSTYQLSANYISNNIFNTNFTLNGFTDWTGQDFLSQNKLLYKLNYSPLSSEVYLGTEWHYYNVKGSDVKSNVLQAVIMVAW